MRQGDKIQIVEGVQAGERVVASGAYGLPDNTKIKVEEATVREQSGADKPLAAKPGAAKKDDPDAK